MHTGLLGRESQSRHRNLHFRSPACSRAVPPDRVLILRSYHPAPGRTGAGHVTKARVPRARADAASPHSGPLHPLAASPRTGPVLWHQEYGVAALPTPALRTATVSNARQPWAALGSPRQVPLPPASVVSSVEWEGNRCLPKAFWKDWNELIPKKRKYSACHKHAP